MYNNKQHMIALIAVIAVVALQLFNMALMANEVHHHCCGHGCPVCACIHYVEETVNTISTSYLMVTLLCFVTLEASLLGMNENNSFIDTFSLIKQKVRLNN